MSYDMKESGERIRQLRIENSLTQEKVASMLNIDRSFYNRIESGKKGCSIDLLVDFSEALNVSTDYLLKDEIEHTEHPNFSKDTPSIKRVSMEEANAFLSVKTGGRQCCPPPGCCAQRRLHQFLEFVRDMLYLRADNDLYRGLAGTNHPRNASGFDCILVHQRVILDFQAQAGDAVVNRGDIALAAKALHHGFGNRGKIIIRQYDLGFVHVVILTARRLEVERRNHYAEHDIEHNRRRNAERDNQ